ncbi:MAG: YigZ family protein [Gemmatimonadota bacterium]|nr:YigZ family protein [Gemmatimonadota bacterium]
MPAGAASAEIRVRGSRFLARLAPARDEAEARAHREAARRRLHDATHHVFGFRSASGEERWDDDGEPSGTGGRPVVAAITSAGVHDAVVVVTRWFGGTKLGTGGLARAYGSAAAAALREAPVAAVRPGRLLRVRYAWADTGAVTVAIEACGAVRVAERHHGQGAETEVAIAAAEVRTFAAKVRDGTAGRARVEPLPGRPRVTWTS